MHRYVIGACLAALAGQLPAAHTTVETGERAADVVEDVARETARVVFSELERAVIGEYYDEHGRDRHEEEDGHGGRPGHGGKKPEGKKGLSRGLAKRDRLPPGLERQLERDGTLPPGLAKRELPADLRDRLPPPPEGHERVIADGEVVLVETATGVIRDIIRDVLE